MCEALKNRASKKKIIQERIEKINQGIVPEGYKETKVGIIPEEWNVKKFKDIFILSQGLQIPIKERFTEEGKNRYIYITNEFINNLLGKSSIEFEYIEDPKESVICTKEDILMTRTGNTGIVISDIAGVFHNNFFKIDFDRKYYLKEFLIYLFNSNYIQHEINRLAGTSTIPDLNHSDFYSINYSFPKINEQQKIANILSTWDRAIELKESLIEEKEEQKKGLKQNLMFIESDSYTNKIVLKDVLEYEQPNKYITDNILEKGEIPVLTANKSFVLGYTNEEDGLFKKCPVIIFDDFTTDIKYVDFTFKVRSSAIKILKLRDSSKVDLKYLYERMTLIKYPRGGHKRYYISEYQFIKLNLPPLPEQQRIAKILSTADKEIELLKQEVEELREQKKGLMQLLLTGIVRVEDDDIA